MSGAGWGGGLAEVGHPGGGVPHGGGVAAADDAVVKAATTRKPGMTDGGAAQPHRGGHPTLCADAVARPRVGPGSGRRVRLPSGGGSEPASAHSAPIDPPSRLTVHPSPTHHPTHPACPCTAPVHASPHLFSQVSARPAVLCAPLPPVPLGSCSRAGEGLPHC